mmetsp:Transcript_92955/g.267434  ORF Transcript_92955/g.267434 Transcript_92955/m.267434 type:complete len:228 (-) Transcript_92955:1693-2376(-)
MSRAPSVRRCGSSPPRPTASADLEFVPQQPRLRPEQRPLHGASRRLRAPPTPRPSAEVRFPAERASPAIPSPPFAWLQPRAQPPAVGDQAWPARRRFPHKLRRDRPAPQRPRAAKPPRGAPARELRPRSAEDDLPARRVPVPLARRRPRATNAMQRRSLGATARARRPRRGEKRPSRRNCDPCPRYRHWAQNRATVAGERPKGRRAGLPPFAARAARRPRRRREPGQ